MDKAHSIYNEVVDFSLSRNLHYYAGLALYYEVTPYHQSGNRLKERENLFRAIDLLKNAEHPKAKSQLGAVYGGLANYYQVIEKTDSAVIASLNSIKILEELKKYRSLAISCMNLAMTYQRLKLPEKQKEYVEKGINYARLSGDNDIIMLSFLQKAHYLTEIKDFKGAKACTDSATPYFNKNYDFSRKQNYYLLKAGTFQNINQNDSAVYYFQKSFENAKQISSRWNMTEPLMQIGYIYLQQNDYTQAEKYLKMGLEIAEADSIKVFMKEGYGTLSDIYAATGNYRQAFDLLQKYNELKDTLQSEDRKKFVLNLEKKYETDKKETQVRMQQLEITKRKSINHGLMALTLAIVIILILVYLSFRNRNRLQKTMILKLEAEKQLLAAEAVLKGEEQERTRLAKDLHDGLGGILSGIKFSLNTMKENLIMTPDNAQAFERSIDMLDSSIQEMRRVAHNLMPETLLKFGLDTALKDFCYNINGSGILKLNYQSFGIEKIKLGESVSVSIYRIIQELVNNILKHANAGNAIVQITLSGKMLLIDVEDDGIGFDMSKLEFQKGIGWRNIRSRLEYLNGKLDLQSQPGAGTSVHIEIGLP
jgi:signal transduction histidine kinase